MCNAFKEGAAGHGYKIGTKAAPKTDARVFAKNSAATYARDGKGTWVSPHDRRTYRIDKAPSALRFEKVTKGPPPYTPDVLTDSKFFIQNMSFETYFLYKMLPRRLEYTEGDDYDKSKKTDTLAIKLTPRHGNIENNVWSSQTSVSYTHLTLPTKA